MLTLADVQQYISGLGIAAGDKVYIGKLDNKKQEAIGVYNRKGSGPPRLALGGLDRTSYGVRPVSLLVHWSENVSDSEKAAYSLYEALLNEKSGFMAGGTEVRFLILQVPEPVDVGTDENDVYEYVIWLDFVYQRK